ncbi:3D domain-containing protein [Salibacterium lacus]|uniref:3D domain-containing protein n=1 Tax=Salibacterium lacus TaxID=1898109 RepID=A0ABW5T198_9BACI
MASIGATLFASIALMSAYMSDITETDVMIRQAAEVVVAESEESRPPAPDSEVSAEVATTRVLGTFEATAYTAACASGCTGITATGVDVRNTTQHEGRTVVAVDPAVIALGTEIVVELADGREIEAVAADTGGAIDGRRVDVLMADYDDAIDFGRQNVTVRTINE